jgi:carbon-monoxide dehydrogenase large subunit
MGNAVLRREDPELVTGVSQYVGDMSPPGTVHLAFVRSVMAHADIMSVDADAARAAPGVLGVFTAADLPMGPQHLFIMLPPELSRLPLADKARYVGDPIAVVVAESRAAAIDAAELVEVDYDPLVAVADAFRALEPDAPLVIEAHGSNLAAQFSTPADPETMGGHDVTVKTRIVNQRISGAPIEPSAVLASPGGVDNPDGVTVWCSTQRPHEVRDQVAAALEAAPEAVRVIAPAVGGGFGPKATVFPEFIVAAWLARRLHRPVKWVETRSENLVNMSQGRDYVTDVELGLKQDGTFCWIRLDVTSNAGAYPGIGAFLPFFTMMMASGPYRIPVVHYEAVAAITNTTPVAAFRGAGRPEATMALERIIDLAAARLGIDPAELRRRNLLAPDEFPLTTPTGANMDCGEYARALDLALETAGYRGLREEQARRRADGGRKLFGIGVSTYVEVTAVGLFQEFGSVTVELDGTITARVGTASHGQGHATAFSQVLGEVLGVPAEAVRIIHSDTGEVARGTGTVASRSLQTGGSAVWTAANEVLEAARNLASSLLEADPDDIVVAPGGLAVAGVPAKTVSWTELARAARDEDLPDGRLAAETDFDQGEASYPFGAHVSVVEIDPYTGDTRVVRHVAVDDCGRILNPMLVEGQVHGGVATGISQALYEETTYDTEGNPRNTNFADYAIPAASELPRFETAHTETPTPLNPLGAKGVGESGTIGSTPAVQSAVLDALAPLGISHLDMPYTPQRVWHTIAAAQAAAGS